MPDEPSYISTERMPELAADIRLVLGYLEWWALVDLDAHKGGCLERDDCLEASLAPYNRAPQVAAAYDRLKAAFGKDE